MTRIGWYVHHHGRGHLTRLAAVAPHLDADIDCFSSLPAPDDLPPRCTWTLLPRDDDARAGAAPPAQADPTANGLLHWAPLRHPGHRERLAAIVAATSTRPFDAFVIDVSVEVTLLMRLLGVPTVLFTQPGARTDEPHRLAFTAASAVIAPWPRELLAPAHLTELGDRVTFTGGISRFDERMPPAPPARASDDVLLLAGGGGGNVRAGDVDAAEQATGLAWRVLGHLSGDGLDPAAPRRGEWRDDPWDDLTSAGVVVSWAGQNAVADLAAAGARAVVVAQDRPFDEQTATARALGRAGLAVALEGWPAASDWPALIDRAAASTPAWERWEVTGAAGRAADAIAAVAGGRG